MTEPENRACAVCARVLNYVTKFGPEEKEGWVHETPLSAPLDHPPVPVPLDKVAVQMVCDFCYGEPVTHVVPARSFDMPITGTSVGDWSACTPCAELIQRNRWSAVITRALALAKERYGAPIPGSRGLLNDVYTRLQAAITGPVRPYTDLGSEGL
jgi:hypothetical protein